jgi:hypothetical protein
MVHTILIAANARNSHRVTTLTASVNGATESRHFIPHFIPQNGRNGLSMGGTGWDQELAYSQCNSTILCSRQVPDDSAVHVIERIRQ